MMHPLEHHLQHHWHELTNRLCVVAVSGGPDSLALLYALASFLPPHALHLYHLDHGSFDAIVCPDALDERDDPRASLAALRSLARDGAVLVVRGVDCGGAQERRFRHGAWHAYEPPRRAHLFNPFNLARLAGGEGFDKKLVQALPDAPGWIRSWRAELASRGAAADVVELLRDDHPVLLAWFGFLDRRAARRGRRTSRLRLVAAARPGPAPGAGNSFAPAARAPAR